MERKILALPLVIQRQEVLSIWWPRSRADMSEKIPIVVKWLQEICE